MFVRLSAAALCATATLAAPCAHAATFLPHRAVYEITLVRSSPGSGVSELSGRMVYELTGSTCEGYTQNMRFVTRSSNSEGSDTLNDLRTSSWEDADGKRLRFSSTQYQNEAVAEASQGDASRSAKGDDVKVELTRPAKKKVSLPANMYFPMQQSAAIIEAAKAGKTLISTNIYDGSEKGESYYVTTAVIGKRQEPAAVASNVSVKNADRLPKVASWPVAISYFNTGKDKEDAAPAYELSFRFFENGITSGLTIDYGEFAIQGEMKELDMLPLSKCP